MKMDTNESINTIATRKLERLERKLQKAKAFLQLARSNDEDRIVEQEKRLKRKRKAADVLSSSTTDEADSCETKAKRANGHNGISEEKIEKNKKKAIIDKDVERAMSPSNEPKMSPLVEMGEVDLKTVRKQLIERRNAAMNQPKFFLTDDGRNAGFHLSKPLHAVEIQQLILKAVAPENAPDSPRWCELLRVGKITHVVVLVVEGFTVSYYRKNFDAMPNMRNLFNDVVEIISPCNYGSSILGELMWVGLSRRLKEKLFKSDKSLEKSIRHGVIKSNQTMRPSFNIKEEDKSVGALVSQTVKNMNNGCSKLSLLLSPKQMYDESFPQPNYRSKLGNIYVPTKESYEPVTNKSPMFGVDCEMCLTTNRLNELTRVSIVDEKMNLIYDTLVMPKARIVDYLTEFSGITPEMLKNVTTRTKDVQEKFRELLPPDAILVGQSLSSDMNALEMAHPYVIDTSVIYNLSGKRGVKTGLKKLSKMFLGEEIQNHGDKGHDSFEDSASALKLVQLKLKKGLTFGDVRWRDVPEQELTEQDIESMTGSGCSLNLGKYVESVSKRMAVVCRSEKRFKKHFIKTKKCTSYLQVSAASNGEVANRVKSLVNQSELTIGYMIREEKYNGVADIFMKGFDLAVKEIYDACANNSVFIVVTEDYGLSSSSENGLCFVKVKTSS